MSASMRPVMLPTSNVLVTSDRSSRRAVTSACSRGHGPERILQLESARDDAAVEHAGHDVAVDREHPLR